MFLFNHYKKLLTTLFLCCMLTPCSSSTFFWHSWSNKKKAAIALITASAIGLSALGYYCSTYCQDDADVSYQNDQNNTLRTLQEALVHQNNEDAVLGELRIASPYILLEAVKKGWCKVTQYCLKKGVNSNARHHLPGTALHYACQTNLDCVKILLQHGAHVNATEETKRETPLYVACDNSKVTIVKHLVEHGADVNAINTFNEPPLYAACIKNLSCVKILAEHGADINPKNSHVSYTALTLANTAKKQDIAKYLTDLEQLEKTFNHQTTPATPELLLRFIACKTHQGYVLAQFVQQTFEIQKELFKHALLHHEDMFIKLCYCNNSTISLQNIQGNTYLRAKYRKLPIIQNTTWWNTTTASLANVTFIFES